MHHKFEIDPFPENYTGSRIVLTTRLRKMDLGLRSSQVHHMMHLRPEMSETLFCTKVFGKEKCPMDLKQAANHILGKHGGLPLEIVVIGGILSKVSRTNDEWLLILENMDLTITSYEDLKGIMSLGYKYLPHKLRLNPTFSIQGNGTEFNNTDEKHKKKNRRNMESMVDEILKQRTVDSVLFKGKRPVEHKNLERMEMLAGELIKEQDRKKNSSLPTMVLKQLSSSPRTSAATTLSTLSSYN